MKKFIVSFALFAIMATIAISVAGQTPAPAQAGGCTDEAKIATYIDFTTHRQSDPAKAYQAAKKYLGCSQGGADQYTEYLRRGANLDTQCFQFCSVTGNGADQEIGRLDAGSSSLDLLDFSRRY